MLNTNFNYKSIKKVISSFKELRFAPGDYVFNVNLYINNLILFFSIDIIIEKINYLTKKKRKKIAMIFLYILLLVAKSLFRLMKKM